MIREANINDARRIAEIEVESSKFAYKDILSPEIISEYSVEPRIPVYERWMNEKRFDLYVYEDDQKGEITGMMGIGMSEDEDKKSAFELHFIYMDPNHLRHGAGSKLMEFFEQKGRDKGISEFVVWVLEKNELAKSFYEKHGYKLDGKEKIFKRWNTREIRYAK